MTPGNGLLIAAPSSGSGKTTVTLGLLRALARRGAVGGAKSGPDYIDPRFHEAACGKPCYNLDAWAMQPDRIRSLAQAGGDFLVVEGAMGLFDGAMPDGKGSAADVAEILGIPVVLVVDGSGMGQSAAAIAEGFARHRKGVHVAGVILNKVASARHEAMLRRHFPAYMPVLGALPRRTDLAHPSRHLGLVQASERPDLEAWLDAVADMIEGHVDLDALPSSAVKNAANQPITRLPYARIAVAQDEAFAFAYPHLLDEWRAGGMQITTFSPLKNEPVPPCDMIFLPGGYPELHAGTLAGNSNFMDSLRKTSQTTDIYGECGGYMILGETLTDANGTGHKMAGLLPLHTSFAERRLHLGYRTLSATQGPMKGEFKGHEFHYATTLKAEGEPLFHATDAEGTTLPPMGLRQGRVCGSFAHVIDRLDTPVDKG
ncbi:cobyrinate a,c-diamide synthase [Litoreibacter arenae]|uniref:Hydrogenobyrinate a,c-diamide synthase n=1 Tax=Litoreibacter arenae DSM 19593 TaxID=1123360 RepID=S9RY75_9RHOB|nr:cobyrinate a,c-diamide synthase [Litoreibacter arenae]EPX78939.1 Cobyrinic acid A,C-diamide synthase [Litoreibacter arenae DSM 19593]